MPAAGIIAAIDIDQEFTAFGFETGVAGDSSLRWDVFTRAEINRAVVGDRRRGFDFPACLELPFRPALWRDGEQRALKGCLVNGAVRRERGRRRGFPVEFLGGKAKCPQIGRCLRPAGRWRAQGQKTGDQNCRRDGGWFGVWHGLAASKSPNRKKAMANAEGHAASQLATRARMCHLT